MSDDVRAELAALAEVAPEVPVDLPLVFRRERARGRRRVLSLAAAVLLVAAGGVAAGAGLQSGHGAATRIAASPTPSAGATRTPTGAPRCLPEEPVISPGTLNPGNTFTVSTGPAPCALSQPAGTAYAVTLEQEGRGPVLPLGSVTVEDGVLQGTFTVPDNATPGESFVKIDYPGFTSALLGGVIEVDAVPTTAAGNDPLCPAVAGSLALTWTKAGAALTGALTYRNDTGADCYLQDPPSVAVADGAAAFGSGAVLLPPVTVHPGRTVTSHLMWESWCGAKLGGQVKVGWTDGGTAVVTASGPTQPGCDPADGINGSVTVFG